MPTKRFTEEDRGEWPGNVADFCIHGYDGAPTPYDVDAVIEDTLTERWGRETWAEFLGYYAFSADLSREDLTQHIVMCCPKFRSRYDFDQIVELRYGALTRRLRVARHMWRKRDRAELYGITDHDVLEYVLFGRSEAFSKIPVGEAGLLPLHAPTEDDARALSNWR